MFNIYNVKSTGCSFNNDVPNLWNSLEILKRNPLFNFAKVLNFRYLQSIILGQIYAQRGLPLLRVKASFIDINLDLL
jgi:hypothetical protein